MNTEAESFKKCSRFGGRGKIKSRWEFQKGARNHWVRVWRETFFKINHFKVNNSLEFGKVLAGGSI